ncbi:hypothetical protein A3B52_00075 [Candidatus Curtissbacteria bacterium RIFCSPLOWO2_01_FULL_41_28]|nr:MAG: hypothetical protein UT99_C0021G0017 [Candidatus Curtissbacteria bacterium GW2011_GWA2_40_31]KKS01276.1 MAG: hypothetical protein UU53_C0015G0030 [Candidatus Curtissbacteria bacterium GW2011_GWC2_41_21]OGD78202.1 MAG: hypothetical protein A2683_03870 [Candidatus Curtissbacteria bacterium RIFCSPHIGHO2_01_FULL_34_40]OGD92353.1 MAG: hypothetical protein A3E14_04270 [Candidatus Curtissbacteria bacterium RIFCSPHIGHO2_12_FULL_41_13]OGD96138.1 MAG: hypothetical protein A3B52_00075 [Candidatus 
MLIGGLSIWYFSPLRKGGQLQFIKTKGNGPQKLAIKTGRPGEFKLVKFSEDVVNPLEVEGIPSNNFSKNDRIGIEGKVNIQNSQASTIRILGKEREEIQKINPSIQTKPDGRIIICCIAPPDKPGEYVLEFLLNGERAPIFPLLFKVSS